MALDDFLLEAEDKMIKTEQVVVNEFAGVRTAPEGVGAYYPAFDVTPPDLVSAIITSRGVYRSERIADHLRDGDAPLEVILLKT